MPYEPNLWATLRCRFSGPYLLADYHDRLDHRKTFQWDWRIAPYGSPPPVPPDILSEQLGPFFRDLAALRLPGRSYDTAVALFARAPEGSPPADFEAELDRVFGQIFPPTPQFWQGPIQIVRLARGKAIPRSPFQLPFKVLAIGPAAEDSLADLRSRSWYLNSPEVRKFGLRIESLSGELEAWPALCDILIIDHDASGPNSRRERDPLAAVRRCSLSQRPRLVITLEVNPGDSTAVKGVPGSALLRLPHPVVYPGTPQFVKDFFYGLIHDAPLHDAFRSALSNSSPIPEPILEADPVSNQSLRIFEAIVHLRRSSDRLQLRCPDRRSPREWLLRAKPKPMVPPSESVPDALEAASTRMASYLSELDSRAISFTSESVDFVPVAGLEAQRDMVERDIDWALTEMRSSAEYPELAHRSREGQQRELDASLQRLETYPLLQSVEPDYTLSRNTLYQLRVHIGNRLPGSIVSGPGAIIDPLLPDPEGERGHQLDISVQAKDFRLESPRTQSLRLPRGGGSEPVYFEVRTPARTGEAQLRICVYFRNHLIQSFLLRALVEDMERYDPNADLLSVRLEFTRTSRFDALDRHQPRLFSIGANKSSSATHELIFKGDQSSGEVTLFPSTFAPLVDGMRKALEEAARDPANPLLARVIPKTPAGQNPPADISDFFRRLARLGRDLYEALFRKASRADLRRVLVDIGKSEDKKLQVVRFDDNFVFPWTLLYDRPLPVAVQGAAADPVCLGLALDNSGNPVACSHSHSDRAFCVKGFWGVRHYVEEMIGSGRSNLSSTVAKPSQDAIRIVADGSLSQAGTLTSSLQQALGASRVAVGPVDPDQLIQILWKDPPERPCVLIIFGHMETRQRPHEPVDPRVVLKPAQHWLIRQVISDRLQQEPEPWKEPRTVVLMMSCESAKTEITTVNDFVTVWDSAGAGAVVGTEAVVSYDLAAELAERLTIHLWNGVTLGEAMASFRRQLVGDGNPLAFLFHAVGDVDLTIQ